MTDQGVSNSDYRSQMVEVKSTNSMLEGSWPPSLTEEKQLFDKAIEGWELTLEVWDYGLDRENPYLELIYFPENSILLSRAVEYTKYEGDYANFNSVKDWIGVLMGTASGFYKDGKERLDNKIK